MLISVIIGSMALVIGIFLLLKYGKLPAWTIKDLFGIIALLSTIGGAVILTLLKVAQNDTFVRQADLLIQSLLKQPDARQEVGQVLLTIIDAQAWNLKMDSIGVILVLLSLGLVISNRTVRGKGLGAEFELTTNEKGESALPVVVQNPETAPVPVTPAELSGDGELPEEQKL